LFSFNQFWYADGFLRVEDVQQDFVEVFPHYFFAIFQPSHLRAFKSFLHLFADAIGHWERNVVFYKAQFEFF